MEPCVLLLFDSAFAQREVELTRCSCPAASRVSGAFLTYTEVPPRGDDTLVKQSFSSVDGAGTKMHLIAYTSKSSAVTSALPCASQDPLIKHMLAQRSSAGRDPRDRPFPPPAVIAAPHPSRPPDPPQRFATPPFGSAPPTADANRIHLQRSTLCTGVVVPRPHTASSGEESRPQTSTSEPRSGSPHDSHFRPAAGLSLSFPSLAPHSICSAPPSASLIPPSAPWHALPLSNNPSHSWPSAYDTSRQDPSARSSSQSRASSHYASPRLSLSPPSISTPTWAPSTAGSSSATTASPFDPHPRHLPPLPHDLQPPGHLATGSDLPSFLVHDSVGGQRRALSDGDQWCPPRQDGRGAEDERQLRLLGRSF